MYKCYCTMHKRYCTNWGLKGMHIIVHQMFDKKMSCAIFNIKWSTLEESLL